MARRQQRKSSSPVSSAASRADIAAPGKSGDRWSWTIGGLLAVSLFFACCFPLTDTDLFWHLKTGEWILEHGQVPYVDLYTFADADKPWIDLHWGFQVVIATIYYWGGSTLLVLVKAAVITAAFAIGWLSTGGAPVSRSLGSDRDALPAWLRSIPWILALVTISGRGYERPEVFSLLFLAIWLWLMERIDERPNWLWWLPALQVLWINMHALFVLGLVVGACRAADELLRRLAAGRFGLAPSAGTLTFRRGSYVAGLCAAAALANPYFEEGALFPLVLYRKFNVEQEFYSKYVGEFHQPVAMYRQFGFQSIYFDAELLLWCVAALSFVLLGIGARRWSLYRALLFAAYSHLAWEAVRNTNIFSLVAASVTCANLRDWWLTRPKADRIQPWVQRANWAPVALLSTFLVLLPTNVWHRAAGENKSFGFGERVAWYPHAAARFAGQRGFPDHAIASHFGVASVYTYHNGPERKIFMDGRLEVCSRATFEMYNALLTGMARGATAWEPMVRDKQGRLPVILLDSRFSREAIEGLLHQPQWRLVFADPSCGVFLETTQAERLGLPLADYTPLMRPPGMKVRERPP